MEANRNKHKLEDDSKCNPEKKFCFEQPQVQQNALVSDKFTIQPMKCSKDGEESKTNEPNTGMVEAEPLAESLNDPVTSIKNIDKEQTECSIACENQEKEDYNVCEEDHKNTQLSANVKNDEELVTTEVILPIQISETNNSNDLSENILNEAAIPEPTNTFCDQHMENKSQLKNDGTNSSLVIDEVICRNIDNSTSLANINKVSVQGGPDNIIDDDNIIKSTKITDVTMTSVPVNYETDSKIEAISSVASKVTMINFNKNMSPPSNQTTEKTLSTNSNEEDNSLFVEANLLNKHSSGDSITEDKSPSVDIIVPDNFISVDNIAHSKSPSVGIVLQEKLTVGSFEQDSSLSVDIVAEEISVDSAAQDELPTIDSIRDKSPAITKETSGESITQVDLPSIDFIIKGPSPVIAKDTSVDSATQDDLTSIDFINKDPSPVIAKDTSVDSTIQDELPSIDSIVEDKLPVKDIELDKSLNANQIDENMSSVTAVEVQETAVDIREHCKSPLVDFIEQDDESPTVASNEQDDESPTVDSNEQDDRFLPSVSSEPNKPCAMDCNKTANQEETKDILECDVPTVDPSVFGSEIKDFNSQILKEQNEKILPPCTVDETKVSDKILPTYTVDETKVSDKIFEGESKLSFSKSIGIGKVDNENKIVSSKLKLDSLIELNSSKADDASMHSEATETGISSVLVENSDSLSGTMYSNENSPAFSTPIESCQASAASSPKPFDGLAKLSDDQYPLSITNKPVSSNRSASKKTKQKSKNAIKSVPGPVVIDEETRMDATSYNAALDIVQDEDSRSSTGTSSKKESKKFRTEVIVPESTEPFTVDKVIEYVWPIDDFGEHYFIQEHISRYLGIMSFKRRYPDIRRRFIEKTEKEYLKERGIVNELACDLGLTAARSEDVMDIIFNDFPEKYEELHKDLSDRKEQKFKEQGRVDYQVASLDKSKMQEYSKKAAADAARWNLAFNRERSDERRYSFDLQTFTMHRPLNRCKKIPHEYTKVGSYPIAVLPGQYTDYYRKYSSHELKALPLHSVLTGPFTAEELQAGTHKVEEDIKPKKEEIPEVKDVADTAEAVATTTLDPLSAEKQPRCKECNGGRDRNKVGRPEPLIICGSCRIPSHPTCIELTLPMVQKIESYGWQCMECKTCAHCNDPNDEERMIFCDMCDRGYHIYCVGLRKVPNGRWHCRNCACCYSCGTRSPAGNEIVKVAEWQHEFKKNKKTKEVNYVCTLCLTCDRYWKRRMYCNSCWKVYKNLQEGGMVKCAACPKYIHKEGCSTMLDNEYLCHHCMKSRKHTAMNHSRILAAAKKKMAAGF